MSSPRVEGMTPQQYARVKSIFKQVCELDNHNCEQTLSSLQAAEPEIVRHVQRLLQFHDPVQAKAEANYSSLDDRLFVASNEGAAKLEAQAVAAPINAAIWHYQESSNERLGPWCCRFFCIGGIPLFIITMLAFITIFLIASYEMRRQLMATRSAEMHRVADTFEQSVRYEIKRKIEHLESLSRSPQIREAIEYLLERKTPTDEPPTDDRPRTGRLAQQLVLRKNLELKSHEPAQFVLRDSAGMVVAYGLGQESEAILNQKITLPDMHDLLHVRGGTSVLHLPKNRWKPTKAAVEEMGQTERSHLIFSDVWFLIPILDHAGSVTAVLSVRDATAETDLNSVCTHMRFGKSGEVVPFDDHGIAIASTRFDSLLAEKGLLAEGASSAAMNLRLVEPGVNLYHHAGPLGRDLRKPLIPPISRAVAGYHQRWIAKSGIDKRSQLLRATQNTAPPNWASTSTTTAELYDDYRGVKCLLIARWLDDFGFGFAVKIDATEAVTADPRTGLWLLPALLVLFGLLIAIQGFAVVRRLRDGELAGQVIGPYRIAEKIAEGGMGVIYRAQHEMLGRMAAVKVLRKNMLDRESRARFDREVRLVAQLRCKHTIRVYDYGTSARGEPYFAMELLRGIQLDRLVTQCGLFDESRALKFMIQIALSLNEAHQMGVVHRDLTPQNLIVTEDIDGSESVVLIDFGLAKPVSVHDRYSAPAKHWSGTPSFMSPERIRDPGDVDPRSDIFALGAVGYFMLEGRTPFAGDTPKEIFGNILDDRRRFDVNKSVKTRCGMTHEQNDTPNGVRSMPDIDGLRALIEACLENNPDKRPKSMSELLGMAQKLLTYPRGY